MLRFLSIIGCVLTIAGCSTMPQSPSIIAENGYWADISSPSVSQNQRVRFLVLHYTALNQEQSHRILTEGGVSAHYLIPDRPVLKDGKPIIPRLVNDDKRAWHAGVSQWGNRNNLNDTAIGIEIVNLGFTVDSNQVVTWYPFSAEQIQAIIPLAKDLIKRFDIAPVDVVAHSDIAPTRKSDPGPLFPWKELAAQGIGAWPNEADVTFFLAKRAKDEPADIKKLQDLLYKYGYTSIPRNGQLDSETTAHIRAFQMHFRASNFSGTADAETEAIAAALVKKYRSS